jgi:hypothetical protein
MENIKFPILFTTSYLILFALVPWFGASLETMVILFLFSPFLIVWMVIRILKDGKPSGKKFNEGHFYEDWDYRANPEH